MLVPFIDIGQGIDFDDSIGRTPSRWEPVAGSWHGGRVEMTRNPAVRLRPPRHQVSRRAIWYWTVRAAAGWLVPLAVEVVWLVADTGNPGPHVLGLVATVVLAAVHVVVMPRWRYRVHRWETTAEAVYTQAGWLNQSRRIAPVSRIQTVDTRRGPLEQLFGLTNITVTTASAAGPLTIDGLDHATAQRLVDELTATTQASPDDAT
jgi:membrane protein YdbS with pleckstrin-like domain